MIHSFILNNKLLTKNFFWMLIIRGFNILSKFMIIAFLIRILGETNFGVIAWSEAILQYFVIFVNFGINIFGASYVVKYKEDIKNLQNFISSVYILKSSLFVVSFLLLLCFYYYSGSLQIDYKILFLFFISTIGDVLFPIWYFQGEENLKPSAIVVMISKTVLVVLCFLLIRSPNDAFLYAILFAFSQVFLGVMGFYTLIKRPNIKLKYPPKKFIKKIIAVAKYYFIGNLSMLVFNVLTVFFIGVYVSYDFVANFDIALKVLFVLILPFEILQAVAMPRIAKTKDKIFLIKLIIISVLLGLVIFAIIHVLGDYLLMIIGGNTAITYFDTLKKLSYLALIVPAGFMIGQCGLVAFGENKKYNFALLLTACLFFVIMIILKLTNNITFNNLIVLRLFSDCFLFCLLIIQGFRSKIFIFK